MKLTYFLAGLALGLAIASLGFAIAAIATPAAVAMSIDLTHHDAAGRTQHATARLNSATWAGASPVVLFADYTSDSLRCSGFEP